MLATANTNASRETRKRAPRLRHTGPFSARLMQAQDEERRRIARELHDGTGQALSLLVMSLANLRIQSEKTAPSLAKAATECALLAKQISSELRTVSYLLHPPLLEEMGLPSALRWFVDGFTERTGIQVALNATPGVDRLPRDVETALFRIVQESLTNVHRHSGSRCAEISLRRIGDQVVLEVKDEGRGIAQASLYGVANGTSYGVGLRGMRERVKSLGGEMEIASAQKGTQIRAVIPFEASEPTN